MQKDVIIKYLPNTTTKEELASIRKEFREENTILMLIISGQDNLLNNLQSLINID